MSSEYEYPGEVADGQSQPSQGQAMEQYAVQPRPEPSAHYAPAAQAAQMTVVPKNPGIGLLVSFFIPGLGSMMNGKVGRGVTILLVYIVGVFLSLVIIGIPIAIGAWIWGMVDGYQSAQKWNHAHGILS